MKYRHTFQVSVTSEADKKGVEAYAKKERRSIPSYFLWLHDEHVRQMALDEFERTAIKCIALDEDGKENVIQVHPDMVKKRMGEPGFKVL